MHHHPQYYYFIVMQLLNNVSLVAGFSLHGALSLLTAVFVFIIWIMCRDFETDKRGFCLAGLFAPDDRFHVMTEHIPTAMVPLWCVAVREQEKIQRNYYRWNVMRVPPSVIVRENAQYEDYLKKKRDKERETMKEVEERIER